MEGLFSQNVLIHKHVTCLFFNIYSSLFSVFSLVSLPLGIPYIYCSAYLSSCLAYVTAFYVNSTAKLLIFTQIFHPSLLALAPAIWLDAMDDVAIRYKMCEMIAQQWLLKQCNRTQSPTDTGGGGSTQNSESDAVVWPRHGHSQQFTVTPALKLWDFFFLIWGVYRFFKFG